MNYFATGSVIAYSLRGMDKKGQCLAQDLTAPNARVKIAGAKEIYEHPSDFPEGIDRSFTQRPTPLPLVLLAEALTR